jgi:hypothetical protein
MVYRVVLLSGTARNAVLSRFRGTSTNQRRFLSSPLPSHANNHGLIVGVYESEPGHEIELTNLGEVIDKRTDGKLTQNLVM